jgi:hypothetical protein
MPRLIPWGTPSRSPRMMTPRNDRRLVLWSAGTGGVLLALIAALYGFGARRVLSPGDLASAHAHIDAKCSQCHEEGRNVSDVRCARCHDPAGIGRMEHAAHVLLGSGDLAKAAGAPGVPCVRCHSDHRGLKYALRSVDDRECASCHRSQFSAPLRLAPLTTFQWHPEFAVFKAQRTSGIGLQFNHTTHFDYVLREARGVKSVDMNEARTASLETCQRCHFLNDDRRAYASISFNAGCAGSVCHTRNNGFLENDTRDVALVDIVQNVPGLVSPRGDGDLEIKTFSGLTHRDPWVMFNAAWLRASLDPAGIAAEREALRGSIAWLDQQTSSALVFARASLDDLRAWESALARDTVNLETRAATATGRTSEAAALAQTAAQVQNLLVQLSTATGQNAAAPADDAAIAQMANGGLPADGDVSGRFEERRQELLRLLATVKDRATRTADAGLVRRADDLRARVERLKPAVTTADADPKSLRLVLSGLDEVVKLATQSADPQLQSDLQLLQGLRLYARRSLGGLDAGEFDMRRQELLRLLDTLTRSADSGIRAKAADLRGRLDTLQRSESAHDDLGRQNDRRRLLERIRVEIALRASRDGATPPPTVLRERQLARQLLDELRPGLVLLDRVATAPPASGEGQDARSRTLRGLLAPCLKCHLFDGEDESRIYPVDAPNPNGILTRTPIDVMTRTGLRLAPVGAAEPVMKRAVFTHAPHVTTTDCARCHGSVIDGRRRAPGGAEGVLVGSTLASDLNSPGVGTCQSCHTSSGARQDCAACHVYHPPSAERMLRAVWSPN